MYPNIIISRIGWMKNYRGEIGDKPDGAGTYNSQRTGHEIYNFKDVNGKVYGFIQSRAKGGEGDMYDRLNLPRIGANPKYDPWKASIDNCLVIFIAPNPVLKTNTVIGWYENAEVFLVSKDPLKEGLSDVRDDKQFNVVTKYQNAYLIPENLRQFSIDHGKNKPGQSNTFYFHDENSVFEIEKLSLFEELKKYTEKLKEEISTLA